MVSVCQITYVLEYYVMVHYSVGIRVLKDISSSIVALVTEKGEHENFWKNMKRS
jgi:hypothetical protein